MEDLPKIAEHLKEANIEVIKTDTDKVLEPGAWGWRIAVFDLRMPNGQLVEYYLPVQEMEQAKKDGNHKLFEDWRNVDPGKLTDAQQEQYLDAFDTSNEKYEAAWQGYLNRTKQKPERIKEALKKTEKVFTDKEKPVKKVQNSKLRSKLVERFKEKGKEDDLLGY